MAEVNVLINGRNYGIACDDGQEQRVLDLGRYVDARLKEIAKAGAASTESHLLVLTALVLADEIFDLKDGMVAVQRENKAGIRLSEQDEGDIVAIIDQLAARIDAIAGGLQKL
jgi:cell division protein ZapA